MELHRLPIHELHGLLRKGEVKVSEILEDVITVIEEREKEINVYISLFLEEAREKALELDERINSDIHYLFGIPVAVKDNIVMNVGETTCASRILLGYKAPYTATAVKKLTDKNAIITGKTNLDEFAMGSTGEYSHFGPTRNPLAPERVTGGSSSGSAAAVAAGEAIAALGSDTGGSVRLPAAYTGTVGFKPTYGRVSRYGLVAFASSLDQISVITRDVKDAAIMFTAISGFDPHDSTSAKFEVPSFDEIFSQSPRGFKVGLPSEYFVEGIEPEIRDRVLKAAELLAQNGFTVKEISMPHTKYAVAVYYLIATSEASSNLARYDGVRYGFRAPDADDLDSLYELTRTGGFGEEVKRRILLGTFALSAGYYEAYYLKAQKARRLIREDFDRAFEDVDLILAPTQPAPPPLIGEKIEDPLSVYLLDIYTVTANLAGLPAISIPCDRTEDGLPIGLQFIGRAFDEKTLLRAAARAESIFAFRP
ncbi:MAG: Asp-tRNA(Asn)/Glu-tRNA(Gln) amidotransferase subunit GatA [Candidatus Hydrothermae bacterium]|nr:Asp-tRNA(Asn)/Glu-tRNA(Gln) amidotransferase subunit GatA [Candidatus Hydrothermae bacterium]